MSTINTIYYLPKMSKLTMNKNLLHQGISQAQGVTVRGVSTQGLILLCRRDPWALGCALFMEWDDSLAVIFAYQLCFSHCLLNQPSAFQQRLWPLATESSFFSKSSLGLMQPPPKWLLLKQKRTGGKYIKSIKGQGFHTILTLSDL